MVRFESMVHTEVGPMDLQIRGQQTPAVVEESEEEAPTPRQEEISSVGVINLREQEHEQRPDIDHDETVQASSGAVGQFVHQEEVKERQSTPAISASCDGETGAQ